MSVIKPYRWISKAHIEEAVHRLLQSMEGTPNFPRWPNVANHAANFLKLNICWDSIPTDNGIPVFARIYPMQRLIELNEAVQVLQDNEGLEQSTLGHEIGHWILHVNHDEARGNTRQTTLALDMDVPKPFLCRSVDSTRLQNTYRLSKQAESIEWQAQYFSSCLLMPRHQLIEAKKGRSLTNYRHLNAMKDELGVSLTNLKHRLKDLGWIQTRPGSSQIYLGQNVPIQKG